MSENFYTILTNAGLAAIANAVINQTQVNFAKLGVGDGNGAYYTPTQEATALRNQVWIGNISSVTADTTNPNWVNVETVIPGNVGGFEIREIGIFDDNNVLLAIGKLPITYKPNFAEGSSKDLYIKAIFEVTNASAVTLKVDPSVIYASKKYVDDKVATVVSGLENVQQQLNQQTAAIDTKLDTHINDIVNHVYFGKDVGNAANSKVITIPVTVPVNYPDGLAVSFRNAVTNTGPVILQVNSRANTTVHNTKGTGLVAGDMVAGLIYTVRYNATRSAFQLQGESGVDTGTSNYQTFWTPGTYNFTVPEGVTRINAMLWGGGGGGGGAHTGYNYGGGGGGGGGFKEFILMVRPGSTLQLTVGRGGKGGIATNVADMAGVGEAGGATYLAGALNIQQAIVHGGGYGGGAFKSQAGWGGKGARDNQQGDGGVIYPNSITLPENGTQWQLSQALISLVLRSMNGGSGAWGGSIWGGGGGCGPSDSAPGIGAGGGGSYYSPGLPTGQLFSFYQGGGGGYGAATQASASEASMYRGGGGAGGNTNSAATNNGGKGGDGAIILRW